MAIAGHCLTISSLLGVGIPVPYLPGKEIKMPKNIYKLKDGTLVPGVTTIINQLDKPQLVNWAWKLGKEGKDWREERDSAGDIGTLTHALVMNYWTGEKVDLSGYTLEQCDKAQACAEKIHSWTDLKDIEPILVEIPLVSEVYKFGGQPDLYARVRDKNRLIDVKTSNNIYDSHWLQNAAYGILARAVRGFKVDEHQILWLPKDNRFGCPIRTDLRKEKKIFKNLLEIYRLRKEA